MKVGISVNARENRQNNQLSKKTDGKTKSNDKFEIAGAGYFLSHVFCSWKCFCFYLTFFFTLVA